MKTFLLILSLVLSLVSGGRHLPDTIRSSEEDMCRFTEASSPDTKADHSLCNRDLCLTVALGRTFAGGGISNPVSVRTTHSGRRTSPQTRSTFRIVKGGKVIDNNRSHPFLTPVFVPLSGMHVSERYLFSICRLRL